LYFIRSFIMELSKVFGYNIKKYRTGTGISQEQLAERCDLSQHYIAEIESGSKSPSFSRIELLAAALSVKPYELFVEESDMQTADQRNTLIRSLSDHMQEAIRQVAQDMLSESSASGD
jgi:transcriptional regulator with XRE-family HTH domain